MCACWRSYSWRSFSTCKREVVAADRSLAGEALGPAACSAAPALLPAAHRGALANDVLAAAAGVEARHIQLRAGLAQLRLQPQARMRCRCARLVCRSLPGLEEGRAWLMITRRLLGTIRWQPARLSRHPGPPHTPPPPVSPPDPAGCGASSPGAQPPSQPLSGPRGGLPPACPGSPAAPPPSHSRPAVGASASGELHQRVLQGAAHGGVATRGLPQPCPTHVVHAPVQPPPRTWMSVYAMEASSCCPALSSSL